MPMMQVSCLAITSKGVPRPNVDPADMCPAVISCARRATCGDTVGWVEALRHTLAAAEKLGHDTHLARRSPDIENRTPPERLDHVVDLRITEIEGRHDQGSLGTDRNPPASWSKPIASPVNIGSMWFMELCTMRIS